MNKPLFNKMLNTTPKKLVTRNKDKLVLLDVNDINFLLECISIAKKYMEDNKG